MTASSGSFRRTEVLLPLGLSVVFFLGVDPSLWLRDTIPALTDLPGHFLPPVLLARDLLQNGTFGGWRHEWFAGFPLYHFYFPLPGLVTVAMQSLVGDALALRIVALAPIVLTPWSVWAFTRLSGLAPAQRVAVTLVGSTSVLMIKPWLFGGNIMSVTAGEFSYGWSLMFLLPYVGVLAGPEGGRWRGPVAGVLLAGALLSHIVPVMVAFVAMLPFLLVPRVRGRLVVSGLVAGALSAFWLLPMAVRLSWVGSMGWTFAPGLGDVAPLELALLLPGAALGLLVVRRETGLAMLLSLGLVGLLLGVVPQGLIHRGRALPLWYLAIHVLAGAGVVHAFRAGRGSPRRAAPLWPVAGTVVVGLWLLVVFARGIQPVNWRETMLGLPETPGADELSELVDRLQGLPPGRIHWEGGELLRRWGGKNVFGLIPYWTEHDVLRGLWVESSSLARPIDMIDAELSARPAEPVSPREVPAMEWSPLRAVARLQLLGVRYLLTHSRETSTALAVEFGPPLAEIGALRLFDLGGVPLVAPVSCLEVAPDGWSYPEAMEAWFPAWSPGQPLLVEEAPAGAESGLDAGCREAGTAAPAEPSSVAESSTPEEVSASVEPAVTGSDARVVEVVTMADTEIRFETSLPGVPHLVRVSAFPNWRIRGGAGPYRAGPSLMVVVPEGRTVTLAYRAGLVEWVGWALTLLAVLGLAVGALGALRRHGAGWIRISPVPEG